MIDPEVKKLSLEEDKKLVDIEFNEKLESVAKLIGEIDSKKKD